MAPDSMTLWQVLAARDDGVPGRELLDATRRLVAAAIIAANVVGAFVVVALAGLALPIPPEADDDAGLLTVNVIAAGAYVALAVPAGLYRGLALERPASAWLAENREPTDAERDLSLALPARLFRVQLALWLLAVPVFVAINAPTSSLLAFEVGTTVALGGLTTGAMAYLLTIRAGRLQSARLLADAPPREYDVPGVRTRTMLTWAVASAVPMTGVVLLGIAALETEITSEDLAVAVIMLGCIALVVGLLAERLNADSVAEPLHELRDALAEVEAGRFDTEVPVYDASELGFVQTGFNRMASGLEERERLRDLFGRHVGRDVARRALEQGVSLGGEEREAVALFVDVIGSTSFAAERSPTEVVDALNAFFTVVVEVTQEHGGLVNKFEGDAALCIFGAPLALEDPCGAALAAAREMQERLEREVPQLQAGIGVSAGNVVAGNVGAADRFEYTVIGDPVNEAARLTELAKERPGRIAVSERVIARASPDEAGRWTLQDSVTLRGRSEPTRVGVLG